MTTQPSRLGRFASFLGRHKSYWLVPLIILVLIFAALLILGAIGGDSLSPFMYSS